jgi:uncharacterized protein (DUF2147 family)
MKKLLLASAFALLGTQAMAGDVYQFGINGGTARVEIPRSCRDISCINFSWSEDSKSDAGRKSGKTYEKSGTTAKAPEVTEQKQAVQAPPPPAPAPAPAPNANANLDVTPPAPPPTPDVIPPASAQNNPPFPALPSSRLTELSPDRPTPPPPVAEPAEPKTQVAVVTPKPEPPVAVVTPKPEPAIAKPAPTGPVGTWLTEKGEGKIRIEECGTALCGVDVDAKPGAKNILSNMKPTDKGRWDGKIYDPKSGNTYVGRMSMKNPDSLRVEGCAFGGMICGGQTWKRVE